MLTITILGGEYWDDEVEEFKYPDSVTLQFEHSLVSLSKWEAKYHKLFLTKEPKSNEEMLGYVEAMLLTPDVAPEVLLQLTEDQVKAIDEYINNPMTGSTVNLPSQNSRSSEQISSELIFFWMSQYQIDISHKTEHLNRLFMLIKIHHAKSQKEKKIPQQKRAQTMAEINAERKKRLGTTG